MITPAITVLGAVEGLKVATPLFEPYVVPITVVILIGVFAIQQARHAPRRPAVRAGHGGLVRRDRRARRQLARREHPIVLRRSTRGTPSRSSGEHGWHGFAVLGAVFLVVTGGEALYADMGHFGKRPIRLAWFALVLPALLLNYFGQGALLLHRSDRPPSSRSSCWRRRGRSAARRPRHGGRDHRVAGAHLRRVLADAAGRSSSATARASTSSTPRRTRSGRSTCRR